MAELSLKFPNPIVLVSQRPDSGGDILDFQHCCLQRDVQSD